MEGELPNNEQHEELEPRKRIMVWCGALAAYNAGILHGEWIDADVEPEQLWAQVDEVLHTSPQPHEEEFAWFDHEGFQGIRIDEYETVENVSRLARLVAEHGEAFGIWYQSTMNKDMEEIEEHFQTSYVGEFPDREGVEHFIEEMLGVENMMHQVYRYVPIQLRMYVRFNSRGYVNDLVENGDLQIEAGREGTFHAYWAF
jgi:antirestriction protein